MGLAMAKPTNITCMSRTAKTGVFHFKVDGDSIEHFDGFGGYLQSATFAVGGYDWAVRYYPDDTQYEPEACISLVLLSKPRGNVEVRFEFVLVDDSGYPFEESISFDSVFHYCGQEEVCEDIIVVTSSFVVQFTIAILKKPFVLPSSDCVIL